MSANNPGSAFKAPTATYGSVSKTRFANATMVAQFSFQKSFASEEKRLRVFDTNVLPFCEQYFKKFWALNYFANDTAHVSIEMSVAIAYYRSKMCDA